MKKKILVGSILLGSISLLSIVLILFLVVFFIINNSISKSDKYLKESGWECSEEEFTNNCIPSCEDYIDSFLLENNLLLSKIEMTESYDIYKIVYYNDNVYLELSWEYEELKSYSYVVFYIDCYVYDVDIKKNIYNDLVINIENLVYNVSNKYFYNYSLNKQFISKLHNDAISSEKYFDQYILTDTYYYDSLVGNLGCKYTASELGNDFSNSYDPLKANNRSFISISIKTLLNGEVFNN